MKKIGYLIFAAFFYVFRICRPKNNKIFCIMTHDASEGSSVGVVVKALKERNEQYEFHYMKKADRESVRQHTITRFVSFFWVKAYHLATSSVILLDNVFLPMAYLKFSSKVKVVQLWHGTGTIKKFGQDANAGDLKRLEKRANGTLTHLVVNSDYTKKQYSSAFGISEDKIFVWGLPRTDDLFSDKVRAEKVEAFYQQFSDLRKKKIVLYAPTFRDDEVDNPKLFLDMNRLVEQTSSDIIFLFKFHPFVAAKFNMDGLLSDRIRNVSFYHDINTLLMVCDVLITDYSSIIFEYCVLEKPMIFYAYDLESFSKKGRGFYEPYEQYVPGTVAKNTDDIIRLINQDTYDKEVVHNFKIKSYKYLDGSSMERFIENIFGKTKK